VFSVHSTLTSLPSFCLRFEVIRILLILLLPICKETQFGDPIKRSKIIMQEFCRACVVCCVCNNM
jgi:hypothetical protein